MRVLVTGATGLVGRTLCYSLDQAGYVVRAALRTAGPLPGGASEAVIVGSIDAATPWVDALRGVDCVVHLAARAHVLGDSPSHADLYLHVNAHGTERLARTAAQAGIRRFVNLSSVKVNGEETADRPYTARDEPRPQDSYARSKWLAEQALSEVSALTGMESLSVRSPLVYGPGVRANFLRLMKLVHRGWPLPFGAIRNRRSMVSVWNLCDLLVASLTNPRAAGRVWMVSDGCDLTTPDVVRRIAQAMSRPSRLITVAVPLLQAGAALTGLRGEMRRLCGSLAVDITDTREELGWSPPLSVDVAIARTVEWYLAEVRSHVD